MRSQYNNVLTTAERLNLVQFEDPLYVLPLSKLSDFIQKCEPSDLVEASLERVITHPTLHPERKMAVFLALVAHHDKFESLSLPISRVMHDESLVKKALRLILPDHHHLLTQLIFRHLDRDRRLALLKAEMEGSERFTYFHCLLVHPESIRVLLKNLNSEDILGCLLHHYQDRNKLSTIELLKSRCDFEPLGRSFRLILEEGLYHVHRTHFFHAKNWQGYSVRDLMSDPAYTYYSPESMFNKPFFSIRSELRRILRHYKDSLNGYNFDHVTVGSYSDLRQALIMQELRKHYTQIEQWVNNEWLGSLHYGLSDFCRWREYRSDQITYDNHVNTVTNQLYVDLVRICEKPQHCLALIQILMPSLAKNGVVIEARVPEVFPHGLSSREKISFFRNSPPELTPGTDISFLKEYPPTLEALSSLVIQGNMIFDLNHVKFYSFKRHCILYELLHNKAPTLARKIYNHNVHWKTLANDINMVKCAGLSPIVAIEQLIEGLQRGGENITGTASNASEPAMAAVSRFVQYFEELPEELRLSLLAMTDAVGENTLKDFFKKLSEVMCVELLARGLKGFIADNHDNEHLTTVPGLSQETLLRIEKRCRLGIDTKQDASVLSEIPPDLAKKVVSAINITNIENQWYSFLRLPNEIFEFYFRYAELENLPGALQRIFQGLSSGLFVKDKGIAICAALLKSLECVTPEVTDFVTKLFSLIFPANQDVASAVCDELGKEKLYAILTRMVDIKGVVVPLILGLQLSCVERYIGYFQGEMLKELLLFDIVGAPLYFYLACKYTSVFFSTMQQLSSGMRDEVLSVRRTTNQTYIMIMIVQKIQGFNTIKTWYTPEGFADEIRKVDNKGNTILHYAAEDAGTLMAYLECLPEDERKQALTQSNTNGLTPIRSAKALQSQQAVELSRQYGLEDGFTPAMKR